MIEQNILKWLELGDSIQKIDVYNRKYSLFIFKLNYLLSKHIHLSRYFYIIIILLFFAQIWELNVEIIDTQGDDIIQILNYLQKIFLFQKIIDNRTNYELLENISISFLFIFLFISILNLIIISFNKNITFFIFINSILNIILVYYINGPMIQIFLFSNLCFNKKHLFNGKSCGVNNIVFDIKIIVCFIFSIIIILFVVYISFYINDIGCINGSNAKSRINCNYTTIIVIIKLFFFFLDYFMTFFFKKTIIAIMSYQLLFLILNTLISIYVYKKVHYYNHIIDIIHHYGWYSSTWFSLCIFLKSLLGIKDITLFVILGLILLAFGYVLHKKHKEFQLMTELNILQGNNLKDIEVYNEILTNLLKSNSLKSRALVAGAIKCFEEYLTSNAELYEYYHKFLNDKHMQKKFSSLNELKILSMISIIYTYNIDKSKDATDLTLNKCYYLINKCKNPALAVWLCAKMKKCTYIQSYYKYVLMEEIKEYLTNKLNKSTNKISLKNIQISSVILYNQYVELFKIKIYEATCNQIEYFDTLRNSITNSKTTEGFLKTGEDILSLRKDILNLWDKIISLNPFSNESEKDYMIYLETILRDNVLKRIEIKRYNMLKAEKLPERNNQYYTMFIQDLSAVLLADGYSYNGKIIYASPNFPSLFMFTGKEILNTSIDDLLPDVVQSFHRYLIEDAIRYSNLSYMFKKQRNVLLKGKNSLLFNIYLYVKIAPNLSYGLIYFIYLNKSKESNFILILDDNCIINGFTEMNQIGSDFTMNNNYGLSQYINGYHIGLLIPEILLQMNYDIKENSFSFLKDNTDIKGYLYPIQNATSGLEDKLRKVLDIIKDRKNSEINNDNKFGAFEEYEDYIKELNSQHSKPFSIFFRIESHIFIGGKYKYYRIYITNDLLTGNENIMDIDSNGNSLIGEFKNIKDNTNYASKEKNKENNEDSSNYNSSISNANSKKTSIIKLKKFVSRQSKILINKDNLINKDKNNIANKEINLNEELINNKEIYKKNNSFVNKDRNKAIFSQNSKQDSKLSSYIEPAELNKLKKEIINKNDSFYIKLIKLLASFFVIVITFLMMYDFLYSSKTIDATIEFLQENIFFTYSKISIACVYNSAFNLQLVKEGIILNENCPNKNCSLFYIDLLQKCVKEVRIQKYNIFSFFPDFLDIFKQKIHAELSIYNRTTFDYLNLDLDMFLKLIISQGLKIIANFTNYFYDTKNKEDIIEVYIRNLLSDSLTYFYSDYQGFDGNEKEKKCNNISYNSPIRIIIALIVFSVSTFIIFYLVCKKKFMEIFLLEKLINFTSTNLDNYLKNLEELKKKFRDDSNDEDEKNMDDLDIGGDEFDGNNNNENDNNNNITNKESLKKKKTKQNKLQQQKLKKQKKMSDYLNKYNIYFGIKISLLFFLSLSYFVVFMVNSEKAKKTFKEFDSSIEQINKVYFDSFETFLIFKEQIYSYRRTNNISDLVIPPDSEITRPKLGNALMYMIKSSKFSGESFEIMENLYNNNSCLILTNTTSEYDYCKNVFSSILTKGLEQSIIQMSIMITNIINELNDIKINSTLNYIYSNNSLYFNYEMFMGYYMLESFLKTQAIFDDFRIIERNYIFTKNNIILALYYIFYIIIIIFLIIFINDYKKTENSFLNFVGILPSIFIFDDESFYKAILRLGQYFY